MKISEPSISHLLLYPALTILKIIGQSCLINSRVIRSFQVIISYVVQVDTYNTMTKQMIMQAVLCRTAVD